MSSLKGVQHYAGRGVWVLASASLFSLLYITQLKHLIAHYCIIGGDKEVVRAATLLHDTLSGPVHHLEEFLDVDTNSAWYFDARS